MSIQKLKEQYAKELVDGMDEEELKEIAGNAVLQSLDKLTNEELLERIRDNFYHGFLIADWLKDSERSYSASLGKECPVCKSTEIVKEPNNDNHVDCQCDDCHSQWQEVYKLSGFQNFEIGVKE